jgi:hypothetical protein
MIGREPENGIPILFDNVPAVLVPIRGFIHALPVRVQALAEPPLSPEHTRRFREPTLGVCAPGVPVEQQFKNGVSFAGFGAALATSTSSAFMFVLPMRRPYTSADILAGPMRLVGGLTSTTAA